MEQVVRDILAQNERARTSAVSSKPSPAPPDSDRPPPDAGTTDRSAHPPELASQPHAKEPSERPPDADMHTTQRSARVPDAVLHALAAERARSPDPAVHTQTTERSPRHPEPERLRTVRVDSDSGFRTPEGIATARAYLPAKTLTPGRTEKIEIETVKVSDPRKLPTVRLPRDRRFEASAESSAAGSPPSPAPSPAEEDASTLRAVPASPSAASAWRPSLRFWIAGVVGVALFSALVVALAARFWPSVDARPSPSSEPVTPSGHPSPPGAAP
jgi:hypothetical protein